MLFVCSDALGQHTVYDEASGAHTGFVGWEAPHLNCAPLDLLVDQSRLRKVIRGYRKSGANDDVLFEVPLDGELDVDYSLTGYVDHDPTDGIADYMGGTHTYDGHLGTDFSLRNFREMDRGVPVYAAEAGVVGAMLYEHPDRNTVWDPDLRLLVNGAVIGHGDSTMSAYLHFRRNSTAVEVGEEVEKGQLLGYVGSSGFSLNPHLHFEVREVGDDEVAFPDPYDGPNNPRPGMWIDQPPYVGDDPLKVFDIGIATRESMGGDLNTFEWARFVERIHEPSVFGALDQENLVLWFLAQTNSNEPYRIEVARPDGSLYWTPETTIGEKTPYGIWYWYAGVAMSANDYGTWQIRMLAGDGSLTREVYNRTFEVGAETEWAPRFLPAGKSIRMNGDVQRDTLRMSAFTGEVSFHVLDQPSFVSIEQDSVVVFQAESDQPSRSSYFQVVATDQNARTDTMWYHIVDPAKPLDAVGTSSEYIAGPLPQSVQLAHNYPNPFSRSTSIGYTLPANGRVRLEVFDVLGREVVTLVDDAMPAGRHTATWDASDVPSGLYLYRMSVEGTVVTRHMMIVK